MEFGGPLTGEAQAIEDAAFAHIAELHTPNTCSLRDPRNSLSPHPQESGVNLAAQ